MGILKNAIREVLKQAAAEQGREIEFIDSPTRVIETTAQAKYNDVRLLNVRRSQDKKEG